MLKVTSSKHSHIRVRRAAVFVGVIVLTAAPIWTFADSPNDSMSVTTMDRSGIDQEPMDHSKMEEMTKQNDRMQHDRHEMHPQMSMHGLYGPYPMTREASGTSWQPDSTQMEMKHLQYGEWSLMPMAFANAVYSDSRARDRGDEDEFIESMAMLMAHRELGPGKLGLHAMLSLDPLLVGKDGYPLLFQTGETADGNTPLIDRQHPHDLFMGLAASYSMDLGGGNSAFVYAGLPGEPALGPATYMHRASGMDNPEAPISHHWVDSTHITFGVITAGLVLQNIKLEASAFNGREPDEHRYDIETRSPDSWSIRASYNPAPNWTTQVSFGRLESPEQLEPGVDIDRTTASVTYNRPIAHRGWQSTFAIGRNDKRPGECSTAYLLESAMSLSSNVTVFGRAERVEKDELFVEGDPLHGRIFNVNKISVGAVRDFGVTPSGRFGIGAVYSRHMIPDDLETVYGAGPDSWLIFLRWKTG